MTDATGTRVAIVVVGLLIALLMIILAGHDGGGCYLHHGQFICSAATR